MRQRRTVMKAIKLAIEYCKQESGLEYDDPELKKLSDLEKEQVDIVRQDMIDRGYITELYPDYRIGEESDCDSVHQYFTDRELNECQGYAWLFGDGSWS